MRGILVVLLTSSLAAFGCASSGGAEDGSSGGSRNLITAEDLNDPAVQSLNALEAVDRLRPRWLRSRTSSRGGGQTRPVVFLNGARYGGLDALQNIQVGDVEQIRFINARDATTRFGTGVQGGVIAVETRR